MIVTFERVKHWEECEAELKRLKGEHVDGDQKEDRPTQIIPGMPTKWSNRPRVIPPENSAILNFEAPKHFQPLLRQRSPEKAPNDEPPAEKRATMFGAGAAPVAGPIDFLEQPKMVHDIQLARAKANVDIEGVNEGEVEKPILISEVSQNKGSIPHHEKSPEPKPISTTTSLPTIKDHSNTAPWWYIGA